MTVSTSARLLSTIAIAVLTTSALVIQGKAQGYEFHGWAPAAWSYVFDDLYGWGIYGADGPEIYVPEQTYLQTYLQGAVPAAGSVYANRE